MKILLICKSKQMEVLGLMYLAAVIKQCGHECKITDLNNSLATFFDYNPDMVGYSIMTGSQNDFKKIDNMIKKHSSVTTFAGGPHVSFFTDDPALKGIDNLVVGESEQYFADILQSNIRYENINSLPWPDRTDFPDMKIRDFISSRGCSWSCNYCYNETWAKMHPQFDRVRIRDPKDVCKEIEKVNPEFAYFQDSCFAIKLDWLEKFNEHYCNIPYHCHLRPKQVNEERVKLLYDSNCASIRMALESASDRLRRLMNRPKLDTNNVLNASKLLKKNEIKFMIQNILAIPTSTIEDDLDTLEFNIRCQPDYAWSSIFAPYPGTVLGDMCIKNKWFNGKYADISDSFFNKSVLNFSEQYKEQVYVLQKIFALCVETQYLPKPNELYEDNLPKLIHTAMRKLGDSRMYRGIL